MEAEPGSVRWKTIFSGIDEEWRAANGWEARSPEQQAWETAEAWDQWAMASCTEWNSGHRWWLDWDTDDGLWLHCQHCPAGIDELYPDGMDVLGGELPLPDGGTLSINSGMVPLEVPVLEWHGPVRARVESVVHRGGPWGPAEYDAWVIVEAA